MRAGAVLVVDDLRVGAFPLHVGTRVGLVLAVLRGRDELGHVVLHPDDHVLDVVAVAAAVDQRHGLVLLEVQVVQVGAPAVVALGTAVGVGVVQVGPVVATAVQCAGVLQAGRDVTGRRDRRGGVTAVAVVVERRLPLAVGRLVVGGDGPGRVSERDAGEQCRDQQCAGKRGQELFPQQRPPGCRGARLARPKVVHEPRSRLGTSPNLCHTGKLTTPERNRSRPGVALSSVQLCPHATGRRDHAPRRSRCPVRTVRPTSARLAASRSPEVRLRRSSRPSTARPRVSTRASGRSGDSRERYCRGHGTGGGRHRRRAAAPAQPQLVGGRHGVLRHRNRGAADPRRPHDPAPQLVLGLDS